MGLGFGFDPSAVVLNRGAVRPVDGMARDGNGDDSVVSVELEFFR